MGPPHPGSSLPLSLSLSGTEADVASSTDSVYLLYLLYLIYTYVLYILVCCMVPGIESRTWPGWRWEVKVEKGGAVLVAGFVWRSREGPGGSVSEVERMDAVG